jgi:hypothetical protein
MNNMKPAAKRKASRRAPAKRAKTARRPSTKTAKAAARRSSAKSAAPKRAKTVARGAPVKRAKVVPPKAAPVAQPKRMLARPKPTLLPAITAPVAATQHKFRIGEAVHLTAGVFARGGATSVYKVTQLLPSDGDEQQYRIKSATEPHERVAKQSQLEPAMA